jgi:hypothetical protein
VLIDGKEQTNTTNDVANSNMVTVNGLHLAKFFAAFLTIASYVTNLVAQL